MNEPQKNLGLEEAFFTSHAVRWQYWIPALRLFRAFRMAIDYRRMALALIAVLLWSGGSIGLYELIPSDQSDLPVRSRIHGTPTAWPWEESEFQRVSRMDGAILVNRPGESLVQAFSNGNLMLWPMRKILQPAHQILFPTAEYQHWLRSWGVTLWGLLICALFGGAISRMAAVDFAGKGELSARQGMRFSVKHTVSYLGAPLIPLVGLLACWIPNTLAGWIALVPMVGDSLVGVLWIFPLIFGALMALVIVGVAAGWPLMIGAISTEASDAFDGLSRAYSYIFNQLWYLVFLLIVMLLSGSAALYLVTGLLSLTIDLTKASVGMGDAGTVSSTFTSTFEPGSGPAVIDSNTTSSEVSKLGTFLWGRLVDTIPVAFVFSFFWTAATLIYFLLRLREDGTPLTLVAGLPTTEGRPPLPIVGIPAADFRERQATQPPTDG